jgi:hypothetical protein
MTTSTESTPAETAAPAAREYRTLAEFWPFYLGEHRDWTNRALHAIGSTLVLGVVGAAIALRDPRLLIAAPFAGYGFAWVGHFGFEKNRPASFKCPLKSFLSDWRLWALTIAGRIAAEIARLEAEGRLIRPQARVAPAPAEVTRST